MTDHEGEVGVVLRIGILFSGRSHFEEFDVLWTLEEEPTPSMMTASMRENDGMRLVDGGILAWDDSEAIAMTVRLKEDDQEEEKDVLPTTTKKRIPPGPVERLDG